MKHDWIYINDQDLHLRYVLGELGQNPLICIGVNPSTAIPDYLDTTLEKVKAIAKEHKNDGWIMLNIYPYRSSKPENLPDNPINDELINLNIDEIRKIIKKYPKSDILCAWGDNINTKSYIKAILKNRLLKVLINANKKKQLKCLAYTKNENPYHPSRASKPYKFKTFNIQNYKI